MFCFNIFTYKEFKESEFRELGFEGYLTYILTKRQEQKFTSQFQMPKTSFSCHTRWHLFTSKKWNWLESDMVIGMLHINQVVNWTYTFKCLPLDSMYGVTLMRLAFMSR